MKRTAFILSILFAAVTLTACETMKGFGRDVETAGDSITDTAQEAQY